MAKDDHSIPVQPEHLPLEGDATAILELGPTTTDGASSVGANTGTILENSGYNKDNVVDDDDDDPPFTPLELEDLQFTVNSNHNHNFRTSNLSEEEDSFSKNCWNYTIMGSFMILTMIAVLTTTLFLLLRPLYATNDDPYMNIRSYTSLENVRQYLIDNQISSEVALYQINSTRYKAATYMTQFRLPPDQNDMNDVTTSSLMGLWLDTYVMTLLYYSLNGPEWDVNIGFLQPDSSTCEWFIPVTIQGSDDLPITIPYGASCNSDDYNQGRVHAIQMFQMPGSYGTIPSELGLLTSLEYLLLSELSISGSLPTELGRLTQLLLLRVNANSITGSIPDTFQSLTNLQVINFVDNQLTGNIPNWIGDSWSSNLQLLGLSDNRLEGTLPTSLAKMYNLLVLALDKNYDLTGDTLPISRLTNLELLYLQQNQFRHRITDIFLYQLTKLQVLDISDNQFSGEIPVHLMNYPALQIMDVSYNQLSEFPNVIQPNGDINIVHNNMTVDHANLQFLALHNNQQISNIEIPTTLAYLTKLTHLDLTGLQFTGTMPEWLGNEVTTLSYLFLADMPTLTPGSIPESFQSLQNLVDLSLQNSSRTGPIPLWVEDWDSVQLLDLSDNELTGELPWTVTDMISLRFLLLHKNRLNGTISEDFTSGTKRFDLIMLDHNYLSGDLNNYCNATAGFRDQTYITADCNATSPDSSPLISCECCNLCCSSYNDSTCNDEDQLAQYNPEWQDGYQRTGFQAYLFSPPNETRE